MRIHLHTTLCRSELKTSILIHIHKKPHQLHTSYSETGNPTLPAPAPAYIILAVSHLLTPDVSRILCTGFDYYGGVCHGPIVKTEISLAYKSRDSSSLLHVKNIPDPPQIISLTLLAENEFSKNLQVNLFN